MLTGLQSLLRDPRFLSLQIDGGFSIADLLDSLPRSQREVPAPPPHVSAPSVPKPHVKRTRVSPPTPPTRKQSAPAKASAKAAAAPLPPALDKRPLPKEAPAVSIANPVKRPP
jgi:hypothetical protein